MPDTNHRSHYGTGVRLAPESWVPPADPSRFDDIAKFSGCTGARVEGLDLTGGEPRENWIDAVRGSDYRFANLRVGRARVACATIKGGIDGWEFADTTFDRCDKREIEVGQFDNHWYPGRPPTRNGRLPNVRCSDGQPVRVTCWDAEPPKVSGGNVAVKRVPWIVWFPYFLWRYVCIRLFGK